MSFKVYPKHKEEILLNDVDAHVEDFTISLKTDERKVINAETRKGKEISNKNSIFIKFRLETVERILRQTMPVENFISIRSSIGKSFGAMRCIV